MSLQPVSSQLQFEIGNPLLTRSLSVRVGLGEHLSPQQILERALMQALNSTDAGGGARLLASEWFPVDRGARAPTIRPARGLQLYATAKLLAAGRGFSCKSRAMEPAVGPASREQVVG